MKQDKQCNEDGTKVIMDQRLSRRGFILKNALALGTVAVCDLLKIFSPACGNTFQAQASESLKEINMPHVSVKLWPGRSEETKKRLTDAIVQDVVNIIGCGEDSVSVSIEEISSGNWKEEVYDPEIRGNMKNLYKKPGYSM